MEALSCPVCFEEFDEAERAPHLFCGQGHSLCASCAEGVCAQGAGLCPMCRQAALPGGGVRNRALMAMMESVRASMAAVPLIPAAEVEIEPAPFAFGSSADVFRAVWRGQRVAVKRLRVSCPTPQQQADMNAEVSMHVGLRHPCVAAIFGKLEGEGRAGPQVVLEYADGGTLEGAARGAPAHKLAEWGRDVVDGLDYLHARRIAHRDLKPANVLLVAGRAKLTDFGISRVLATIQRNTSVAGTPQFAAPELLQHGSSYGPAVDVYSLAVLLLELFGRQDAYPRMTVMQVMARVMSGAGPVIPDGLPGALRALVLRGISATPGERPALAEFRAVMDELAGGAHCAAEAPQPLPAPAAAAPAASAASVAPAAPTAPTAPAAPAAAAVRAGGSTGARAGTTATAARAAERRSMPLPVMDLPWPADELAATQPLRDAMVDRLQAASSFAHVCSPTVLRVMRHVPRHVFVSLERISQFVLGRAPPDACLRLAYDMARPWPACATQNSSSPEVIAAQLSLVPLNAGDRVLFLGAKGGYIQALACQITGFNGQVWICSADPPGLRNVCDKFRAHVPDVLSRSVRFAQADTLESADAIEAALRRAVTCEEGALLSEPGALAERPLQAGPGPRGGFAGAFNAILVCGATEVPPVYLARLLAPDGHALVPVDTQAAGHEGQVLTIIHQRGGGAGEHAVEVRELKDWGVRFGRVA